MRNDAEEAAEERIRTSRLRLLQIGAREGWVPHPGKKSSQLSVPVLSCVCGGVVMSLLLCCCNSQHCLRASKVY